VHQIATVLVLGQLLVEGCPTFDIQMLAEVVPIMLLMLFSSFTSCKQASHSVSLYVKLPLAIAYYIIDFYCSLIVS
jgi:hypothetical protein